MNAILMNSFLVVCQLLYFALFAPCSVNSNISVENKPTDNKQNWVKIEANYPKINGMKNTAFQNNLNKDIENKVNDFLKDVEKSAKDTYDALGKTGFSPYEGMVNYEYFINGPVLSIIMEYYSYLGGAHGSTLRESINVNADKGELLQLKDMFKDKDNYKQYILKNINSEMSKDPEKYFSQKLDSFNENNFYLDKNGNLVIYFNQYDIAPYAAGIIEFKMPLN